MPFYVWFRRILMALAFVVLAAVAVFAAMEITARVLYSDSDARVFSEMSNDEFHHPRPFVMAAGRPGNGRNVLGYPSELPVLPKPPGEFRIFVVGGSTVYEGGPHAIPAQLQEIFRREGQGQARVYNYGAVSSISRQDAARVWIDIAGFQPDLIVQYGGGNDLNQSADPRPNYPHRFVMQEIDPFLNLDAPDFDWISMLAMNSVWVRKFNRAWLQERVAGETFRKLRERAPPVSEHMRVRAESFAQNMRWAAHFARASGANFAVVLQPVLSYKLQPTREEIKFLTTESVAEERLARDFFIEELGKYKNEFSTFDLTRIFETRQETVHRDKIHVWNEKFNPLLAEALHTKIAPYLKAEKPTAALPGLKPETDFIF